MTAQTQDPEVRRAFPRRRAGNVEMFCYRASPSATPQQRRNIGSEIVDISQGGARVRVSEAVGRGETVTLELRDRASGEAFRARGEVRWVSSAAAGHLVGVQFREHYTPMGLRETFTAGVKPPAEPKPTMPPPGGDIVLAPEEKRQTSRFSVDDYVVTLYRQGSLAPQGLKRNLGRRVLDLSQSGAQMEVSEAMEAGALVQFTLHFNTFSNSLDALAAIRWCRPDPGVAGSAYRAGIQFLNVGDPQRKMIEFMRKVFAKPKRK